MKTKIRNLITVCVLGFIGLNTSAANYSNTNKTLNAETSGLVQFLLSENMNAKTDFQKEAQLGIKLVADREEAKAVQKLIDAGFTPLDETPAVTEGFNLAIPAAAELNVDLQNEARLETKMLADREEAKVVQKLRAEGRL